MIYGNGQPSWAILSGREVIATNDVIMWAKWLENNPLIIEETFVCGVRISTIFIGLNHQFGEGPPLWFETVMFGGEFDEFTVRYSTWDEAVQGHAKAVKYFQRQYEEQ